MAAYEVRHFCTADGADVFGAWFDGLRDRQAQGRIVARVDRLALGFVRSRWFEPPFGGLGRRLSPSRPR